MAYLWQFPDYYFAVGRLKRGVSVQQAQADIAVIARQLAQQYPRTTPSSSQ
jgi:hypothetical protein